MKSRPILFSAPMVRALLAGTKTQTRRVCKPAEPLSRVIPIDDPKETEQRPPYITPGWFGDEDGYAAFKSPYGVPGDQLWVRETHAPQADCWGAWDKWLAGICHQPKPIIHYAADFKPFENDRHHKETKPFIEKWRPSIHMPRFASRITLEIIDVRVERLHDISEADATAEGTPHSLHLAAGRTASENYAHLWETINGDDSWDLNPWVWVIEFKRIGAAV